MVRRENAGTQSGAPRRTRAGRWITPRHLGLIGATILGAAAFAAPANAAIVAPPGDPGVAMTVFPGSNIAIADGLPAGTVDVLVLRNGTVIGEAQDVAVSGGTVEINHTPDVCWDTITPDILAGDVIQVLTAPGDGWEMTVGNATINPPTVVGNDVTATGTVVLTAAQEFLVRLVKGAGDSHIEAPLDPGTDITFGPGDAYTASFTNVAAPNADIEARVVEGGAVTIAETAATQACPEPVAATAMTALSRDSVNFATRNQAITVSGVVSGDHTVRVRVGGGGAQDATLNGDGTWTFPITAADVLALPEGPTVVTAEFAGTAAPPDQTRTIVKDTVAPVAPTATPAPGTYATAQSVTLTPEAGSIARYTNDGSVPNAASLPASGPIPVTATQTLRAVSFDGVGNPSPVATFAYVIAAPAGQNTGGAQTGGGQAGGGAPAATLADVAGAGAGAGTTTAAPAKLALKKLSTAARVKRSVARLRGIGLKMELPDGTNVVKINIYRKAAGGKLKLISSGFKAPSRSGAYSVRQNHAALKRLLTVGSYEVQVTPGASRTDLGTTKKASFKIVR